MSELNRQQHEELGGSFSTEPFYGGFIASLGGRYIPTKASQTDGNHYAHMVNNWDSVERRLANAFQGYIYKDSADTDAQFSVKPFTFQHRGLACVFAGQLAIGPLVVGTNNIWVDLTGAPTVSIAFGVTWPTTTHLKLGTINMPASGPWLPADLTREVGRQAANASRQSVYAIRKGFDFNSGASFNVATVPAGSRIIPVHVIIDTLFDGTAPTLEVGDAVDPDGLIVSGEADLKTAGKYDIDRHLKYATDTQLTATLNIDGSTQGSGVILLQQW